ncbi:transposase [Clostridium tetanomorphum DSM 665]|nr:transposase [Clostridium tetanomorphum DSM 665]NRZ96924.1 hypothetical protein [Clostridium tetanomorphum]
MILNIMKKVSKYCTNGTKPVFHEYFQRKIGEGKTKPQALVCIMRRLVNIVYGMLKNKTEYRVPQLPTNVDNMV